MNVRELIAVLNTYDPEMIVTVSGQKLGFGADFELAQVHRFDNEDAIQLIPGEEIEE